MDISKVATQKKLKPRTAPYWQKLAVGRHVGLRKTTKGMHWQAKFYDPATSKETATSLGDFSDLPANERFGAAVTAAQQWFKHMGDGGQRDVITVGDACTRYVTHLETQTFDERRKRALSPEQREARAKEARRRFAQYVHGDPIARIALPKLRDTHVKAWRSRRQSEGISTSTLNRDMVALRSALNLALDDGYATTPKAWRKKLSPASVTDARERNYLTREQRRSLLAAVDDDHLRAFLSALSVLPLRPGALAALTVADWDKRERRLRIRHDKAGQGRVVPIPDSAAQVLDAAAGGKLPAAPLFSRWDGKAWDRFSWRDGVRAAAKDAGLPDGTCAYELRHAVLTDLTASGLDLFTIGRLAGTSATMIERTYGHLQESHARDALAGLAL